MARLNKSIAMSPDVKERFETYLKQIGRSGKGHRIEIGDGLMKAHLDSPWTRDLVRAHQTINDLRSQLRDAKTKLREALAKK